MGRLKKVSIVGTHARQRCRETQHHVFGSRKHSLAWSHFQTLVAASLRLARSLSLRMTFSSYVRNDACIGVSGRSLQTGTDRQIVRMPQVRKIILIVSVFTQNRL